MGAAGSLNLKGRREAMYRIDVYVKAASIEPLKTLKEAIAKIEEIEDDTHICRMVDMEGEGRDKCD